MAGDTNDDDDLPGSSSRSRSRPRPARPARLSVSDIAENQRERSRHSQRSDNDDESGLRPPPAGHDGPQTDEHRRSTSGGQPASSPGRFASLKRKLTTSKRSNGFLLNKVSSTDTRRSRPSSQTVDSPPTLNTSLGQGAAVDGTSGLSKRDDIEAFEMDGTSQSKSPPGGGAATPSRRRNGQATPHTTPGTAAVSSPPSHRSSRISSDQYPSRTLGDRSRPVSAAVDPAQLVRMALNLSESRRMQLDPGHLPSIAVTTESRQVSTSYSSTKSPASGRSRENFHEDHRSLPRPATGTRSSASRSGDAHHQGSSPLSSSRNSVISPTDAQPEYIFSPATLERAQKARRYMELSAEYRRLLHSLPPLRPCQPSDGSLRVSELGRPYNPLQYIRNRKTRIQKNIEFDSEADGWSDPIHVRYWVDSVESEAQQPGYQADDVVLLPQWSSGISKSTNPKSEDSKLRQQTINSGRKELRSKRFDWKLDPSDLLEDAYWLEQDNHKTLICSKHGHTIFHTFNRPLRAIQEKRVRSGTAASGKSHDSGFSDDSASLITERRQRPMSASVSQQDFDGEQDKSRHRRHIHGADLMKRTFFHKRHKSESFSSDEGSPDEYSSKDKGKGSQRPRANIGPLEKHMQTMIDQESRNERVTEVSPKSPSSAYESPEGTRRHGISGELFVRPSNEDDRPDSASGFFGGPLEEPRGTNQANVPRISVERYDTDRATGEVIGNGPANPSRSQHKDSDKFEEPFQKKKRHARLGFWQRPKSKAENQIEVTDFAGSAGDAGSFSPQYGSEWDSGVDSLGRIPTAPSTTDGRPSVESDMGNDTADSGSVNGKAASPNTKSRFFKGGRIGELVRHEGASASSVVFKRQVSRRPSPDKSKRGTLAARDSEDLNERQPRPLPLEKGSSYKSTSSQRRSSSAGESKIRASPQYHIKNLPTFQSSAQMGQDRNKSHSRSPGSDHISKQQEERRMQRINSRLSSMAPSYIDTSEAGTSSRDLSRYNTRDQVDTNDRRQSYGFGQWAGSAAGVRAADKRLSAVMSAEDELGRDGPPKSPAFPSSRASLEQSPSLAKGWSLANVKVAAKKAQTKSVVVTRKDVAQVRSLLLSAGIRAQAIARRADMPRDEVTDFLRGAFETSGQDVSKLGRMSIRQAHVMAAQLISDHLSRTLHEFDDSVVRFRADLCQHLMEQTDDLRDRATSDLMPKVQSAGGDADAFVARLTTTHTLAIRQVMDSVEKMLRKRRRRLRYVQRQLFNLLEWTLVALMWWIWLVVFILRVFRGIFAGAFRTIRWLLWL